MATPSQEIKITDVDTRWPYRAGYPRLCPQPVASRMLPDEHPILAEVDLQQLQRLVKEVLDEHNITLRTSTWDNLAAAIQINYRGYDHELDNPSPAQIRLTVHCVYDKEANKSVTWASAIPKIYQVTKQLASQITGVELFDYEYMKSSQFCEPLYSDQSLLPEWEREGGYREKVLGVFEDYPRMFQVMMPIGLRAVGPRASDHKTVLFLSAINAEDDRWAEIQDKLQSILPSNISIEIRQRTGSLLYNDFFRSFSQKDGEVSLDDFSRPPKPGCEISPQTNTERQHMLNEASTAEVDFLPGGKMGGYVITQNETGKKTTYGLTNGHVVLSPSRREATYKNQHDQSGQPIAIQSPLGETRQRYVRRLTEYIADHESDYLQLQEIYEATKDADPDAAQKLGRRLTRVQAELDTARDNLRTVQQQNPCIGSVAAATHSCRNYRLSPVQNKLMMDVGLVDVGSSVPEPRNEWHVGNDQVMCDTWDVDGLGKDLKFVAKLGDTGLKHRGVVNSFKADIIFDTFNGNDGKPVSAWAVSPTWESIPPGGAETIYRTESFAAPGESGTFIVSSYEWKRPRPLGKMLSDESDAFIVGLLIGGCDRTGLGLFTPFDAVKDEVEELTSAKMVWPRKRATISLLPIKGKLTKNDPSTEVSES